MSVRSAALGVYLVRTLMDECSYAREGSENVVRPAQGIGRAVMKHRGAA